jgi:hypothetical protein
VRAHLQPSIRRAGPLRLAACGVLAGAALMAGLQTAQGAPAVAYTVNGKVTANSLPKAESFAVRAATTSASARGLRGRIVVVQVGVLTRFRTPKGKAASLRGLRVGDRVTVTWNAKSGTSALVASVDAPRLVVDRKP